MWYIGEPVDRACKWIAVESYNVDTAKNKIENMRPYTYTGDCAEHFNDKPQYKFINEGWNDIVGYMQHLAMLNAVEMYKSDGTVIDVKPWLSCIHQGTFYAVELERETINRYKPSVDYNWVLCRHCIELHGAIILDCDTIFEIHDVNEIRVDRLGVDMVVYKRGDIE